MIGAEVGFQVENTYFSMVANREQIYCTVGTSEKAGFLTQHFGIHRDRIFNSRDTSFVPDIMAATKGRGVDVALNSLSGELLHATWRCIAKFGIMVEIGKRDFLGRAHLAMDVFEQNRSFQGVDLTEVCTQRPVLMNSLLQRAIRYYEQGHIKPISPIKQFDATQVEDAFRFMQKGQHIGKIVITLPQAKQMPLLRVKTERRELTFRQDRAYLIVGGLGGLGRSVASWMVERGAAHVIFFSRSAGAVPKDDPYLRELEAQGCAVQTFSGSVAKAGDVARVIRAAGRPIAGVLQASLVLSVSLLRLLFVALRHHQLNDTILGCFDKRDDLRAVAGSDTAQGSRNLESSQDPPLSKGTSGLLLPLQLPLGACGATRPGQLR